MSTAANCKQKLATKLSSYIFIAVKVSLLVLCVFEALAYIWENLTQSRHDVKSNPKTHGQDSHATEITSSTSVLILHWLGVAEVLLGVMLVGCVLRRWPTLLDPQPPSPNLRLHSCDEDDVTPDQSPIVQLIDVFRCDASATSSHPGGDLVELNQSSQMKTTDSANSILSKGTSTQPNSPASAVTEYRTSSQNPAALSSRVPSSSKHPPKSILVQSERPSIATAASQSHRPPCCQVNVSVACSDFSQSDCTVTTSQDFKVPTLLQLSKPSLESASSSKMLGSSSKLTVLTPASTLNSDPVPSKDSAEMSVQSNHCALSKVSAVTSTVTSTTLPKVVTLSKKPVYSTVVVSSKIPETSVNNVVPVLPVSSKASVPSGKCPTSESTDHSIIQKTRASFRKQFSPVHTQQASRRLRKYQIKAEQVCHQTENKRKMLGALCVRRNLLTSDLVTLTKLVQDCRQQLDSQRDTNKALMKYIDHVTTLETGGENSKAAGNIPSNNGGITTHK